MKVFKLKNIPILIIAIIVYFAITSYLYSIVDVSSGLKQALAMLGATSVYIVVWPFIIVPEKRLLKNQHLFKNVLLTIAILIIAGLAIIGTYMEFPWLNGYWSISMPLIYIALLLLIAEIIIKRYKVIT